ncbi:hypothetical protein GCM10027614_41040 [Micromonospora vulcania]
MSAAVTGMPERGATESSEDDLVAVRLHTSAVPEHDLDPTNVVGLPPHGVDRLTGVLIWPIVVGLGTVGPEDPDQVHRPTGHVHPQK